MPNLRWIEADEVCGNGFNNGRWGAVIQVRPGRSVGLVVGGGMVRFLLWHWHLIVSR